MVLFAAGTEALLDAQTLFGCIQAQLPYLSGGIQSEHQPQCIPFKWHYFMWKKWLQICAKALSFVITLK